MISPSPPAVMDKHTHGTNGSQQFTVAIIYYKKVVFVLSFLQGSLRRLSRA
jgi:hypothetical protein